MRYSRMKYLRGVAKPRIISTASNFQVVLEVGIRNLGPKVEDDIGQDVLVVHSLQSRQQQMTAGVSRSKGGNQVKLVVCCLGQIWCEKGFRDVL